MAAHALFSTPQQLIEHGAQFAAVHGFDEVGGEAGAGGGFTVALLAVAGEGDKRGAPKLWELAQVLGQREAVHPGQANIDRPYGRNARASSRHGAELLTELMRCETPGAFCPLLVNGKTRTGLGPDPQSAK